jgi:hypothetical protein
MTATTKSPGKNPRWASGDRKAGYVEELSRI